MNDIHPELAKADSIGVVVIGRNEGERLRTCLASIAPGQHPVIYVDSGSSDGSVALAHAHGATVVDLDTDLPFSAARARNAGFARLLEVAPDVSHVQFVDGDCELVDDWLAQAMQAFAEHDDVAVVCGRRRERFPEASPYNRLCDLEWNTPIGEVRACGGDAVMRADAFAAVEGFNPAVVAGEEPELCYRLRKAGWRILRIDAEMTRHDAAMTHIGQWWRRAMRSGLAWAEAAADRPGFERRRSLGVWFWAGVWPITAALSIWLWPPALIALVLMWPLQWLRIAMRAARNGMERRDAQLFATHCLFAKWPQAQGQLSWLWRRITGRDAALIEYKRPMSEISQNAVASPQRDGGL